MFGVINYRKMCDKLVAFLNLLTTLKYIFDYFSFSVGFVSAACLWSNSKYGAGSARPDRPNQDLVWPERSGTVPGYKAPCATSQASGKKGHGQKVLVNKASPGEESLWHISAIFHNRHWIHYSDVISGRWFFSIELCLWVICVVGH